MSRAAEALGPTGPFRTAFAGFTDRDEQQAMAAAVERALTTRRPLVCEAGTGTGKTFAYLVPLLQSGKRALVSTGTKHLQDQLFDRDLPLVRRALGRPVRAALLKGRTNYLCRHRLATSGERGLERIRVAERLAVQAWAGRTRTGDIAELTTLPENASIWPLVTSTTDNCLGGQCDRLEDCFVIKARRRALDADIVVVNHHLLFADLALREEGFGELLPEVDVVVLDEAHLVPAIATQFFGRSISTRQLGLLVDDALMAQSQEASDVQGLHGLGSELRRASENVRGELPSGETRAAWRQLRACTRLSSAVDRLRGLLAEFGEALGQMASRGPTLGSCAQRAASAVARLDEILCSERSDEVVWVETFRRSVTWHVSPLEVASILRPHLSASPRTWIFTSATLSVAGNCRHFATRIGLDEWDELCLASPFDYARQWLGYVPADLPDPRDARFHRRLSDAVLPVLEASRGRAFLLFTSYRGMDACHQALKDRLAFPLLVQGEAPKSELLERFRRLGDAVLFATSSFWQGVDVPGDALACVVIEKLPFEAPGDPLLSARLAYLRAQGEDPFRTHQLPQAVIALKQGVGRLIRGERDRGVVVIGDSRLLHQGYGRVFLDSLPPLPLTRSLEDVRAFYRQTTFGAQGNENHREHA